MTRIFDLPDGTLIEVRSDQAIRWKSNSCQCCLVFEKDTLLLDFAIDVCQLHKNIANGRLVADVLSHNQIINRTLPSNPTRTDRDRVAKDRETESKRIARIGRPQIRADSSKKDAIEDDLRNKGR